MNTLTIDEVVLIQPLIKPSGNICSIEEPISPTDYLYTHVFRKYVNALTIDDIQIRNCATQELSENTAMKEELNEAMSALERFKTGQQITTEDIPKLGVLGLETLITIHQVLAVSEFANGLLTELDTGIRLSKEDILANTQVKTDPNVLAELTDLADQLQKAVNTIITTGKPS